MTKALLEYETIDSDQIDDVMAGKKVRAPKPSKSSNDKKMPPSGKAPTSSKSHNPQLNLDKKKEAKASLFFYE